MENLSNTVQDYSSRPLSQPASIGPAELECEADPGLTHLL